jgi:hypothetical protein
VNAKGEGGPTHVPAKIWQNDKGGSHDLRGNGTKVHLPVGSKSAM